MAASFGIVPFNREPWESLAVGGLRGNGMSTRFRAAVVALALVVPSALMPAAAGAKTCSWFAPPIGSTSGYSFFFGVTALSACSVWAVGYTSTSAGEQTLIEHWNGSSWSIQTSSNPATGSTPENELDAVAATSATNAWAVGGYTDNGNLLSLAERWNGTSWVQAPVQDDSSTFNVLRAVASTGPGNSFAAGQYFNGSADVARVERWNGSAWVDQTLPHVGTTYTYSLLRGIATTSSTNAWAVGTYWNISAPKQTLIEHWNGKAWKIVKSPNPGGSGNDNTLSAVTTISPSDAWAVGSYIAGGIGHTLILHWNGVSWKVVKSPNPGGASTGNILFGVSAASSGNAWAAGDTGSGGLMEEWNGSKWRVAFTSAAPSDLFAVDASSPADVWAVGQVMYYGSSQVLAVHCC
jgi:hypothetical protein